MRSNRIVWLTFGICLVLGISAPVSAFPIEIGIGGGALVPVSDAADALETGWNAKGFVRFPSLGLPVDLGAALGYSQSKFDTDALAVDGTTQMLSGLAKVSWTLPFAGPLKPYLTAGLGAFRIDTDVDDDGVEDPESQTQFGIDAGAGVRFGLFGIKAFVEGTFQNIYTDQGFDSSVVDEIETQVIPVTFGITF